VVTHYTVKARYHPTEAELEEQMAKARRQLAKAEVDYYLYIDSGELLSQDWVTIRQAAVMAARELVYNVQRKIAAGC
jgi:hypothetical protein